MILSTTPTLEGKTIREYRGIVVGEAILGANIFRICSPVSATSSAAAPAPTKKSWPGPGRSPSRSSRSVPRRWGQRRGGHRHRLRGGGPERQHADGQHQRHRRGDLARQCPALHGQTPVTSRPEVGFFVGCDAQRWAQVSGAQGLNVSNAPMILGWPGMREKMARPGEGAGTWGGTGPEGRQSCSILLFDNELSFDISKQK